MTSMRASNLRALIPGAVSHTTTTVYGIEIELEKPEGRAVPPQAAPAPPVEAGVIMDELVEMPPATWQEAAQRFTFAQPSFATILATPPAPVTVEERQRRSRERIWRAENERRRMLGRPELPPPENILPVAVVTPPIRAPLPRVERAWRRVNNELLDAHRWQQTEDGSLRNGVELISPPLHAASVGAALAAAYQWANDNHFVATSRTGMHIHVNMAGRTPDMLLRVMQAYVLAEPLLFAVAGEQREQNIHCVPWYLDPDQYSCAAELVKELRAGVVNFPDWNQLGGVVASKYSALNILPLFKYHTLEFRHIQTPDTAEDALRWSKIVATIVNKAPFVTRAAHPRQALMSLLSEYVTSEQMAQAAETAVTYDVDDVLSRMERESQPCTYKALDWGLPASLQRRA